MTFEPRTAIKAQALADFIAEMTPGNPTTKTWKLYVDGSSNITSSGAGVILESQNGVIIEQSVPYEFPVSNNQAEYEALLAGLTLAKEIGAKVLEICSDSQHVPRERNARADLLSKLASTKPGQGNRSLIQEVVRTPSVSTTTDTVLPIYDPESWTSPILQYLLDGVLPEDPKEANRVKREAANYTVILGQLYKRRFSQSLLKCVEPEDMEYILRKIHEGNCGHHIEGKTLAQKVVRARYVWPSVIKVSMQQVKNCSKCQIHADFHQAAPHQLNVITAERPFDYYTKWTAPVSHHRHRLLHQMDRGQALGLHHGNPMPKVFLETHNNPVESANKIIVKGLKKRLNGAKGLWADELGSVLWSYRTTPQISIGETPFPLTYGIEAVVPVEIGDPSPRRTIESNDEEAERDLTEEVRSIAHMRELALKQRIGLR
ncbi:uncharacterized protein [Arachis hypogaea]|uniref:uncharacterized protein n=1 Tax=Arachis hypogaea TaxID=3818 RepID=UPI0007AF1D5E|nr:uncharacterized protein LOC112763374 [Arachis hypogaea]